MWRFAADDLIHAFLNPEHHLRNELLLHFEPRGTEFAHKPFLDLGEARHERGRYGSSRDRVCRLIRDGGQVHVPSEPKET
jgi:hypothetical protein